MARAITTGEIVGSYEGVTVVGWSVGCPDGRSVERFALGRDDGEIVQDSPVGDAVAIVGPSSGNADNDDDDAASSISMATPQVTTPYGEPGTGGDVSRTHRSPDGIVSKSSHDAENPNVLPEYLPSIRFE